MGIEINSHLIVGRNIAQGTFKQLFIILQSCQTINLIRNKSNMESFLQPF